MQKQTITIHYFAFIHKKKRWKKRETKQQILAVLVKKKETLMWEVIGC